MYSGSVGSGSVGSDGVGVGDMVGGVGICSVCGVGSGVGSGSIGSGM